LELRDLVSNCVYAHPGKLNLEAPTASVLRGQAECLDCTGSGEADQHSGMRKGCADNMLGVDQGTGRPICDPCRTFGVNASGAAVGVTHPEPMVPIQM
jgi:hypothetical protein